MIKKVNTLLVIIFSLSVFLGGCILNWPKTNENKIIGGDYSKLDISGQNLTKVPSDIFTKKNLEELDISNNKLTGSLPAEIGNLENLRVLKASNNQMTGLPAELGRLQKLEILDFSNNKITGLPLELGNLKNLKALIISGNDYSKQDLDKIISGLPSDVKIIK